MRINLPKNNFSSGQIDRDVKGRFDLPLYQNGFEISRNFFHTIKGDCYFRTGFEYLDEIGNSALYEFRFNQEQAYLLVFDTQKISFYTYDENNNFVKVIDNYGNVFTLSHPYGNEIFNLNMTQNCDVIYICHDKGQFPEYQLKRTASNNFTLTKTTFTNSGTASLSNESASKNHGFPFTCAFYENRMNRCSSTKYPTYLYGSKGAEYDNITTGTGTNDGYQFDLSEANSNALWLVSGVNSLLVGTAEGILTINGGSTTSAITPTDITAKLSCRDGVSSVKPIHKDNYVFFVGSNQRKLYMFEYDVLLEQFKATDLSKGNYEITKGKIKKLVNKNDRFGLIFALCGTKLLSICFSNDEAINSWSEFITDGEFVDICSVVRPDGDFDLFANIKREINGQTKYYLEKLSPTVEFSRFEDFVSDVTADATAADIIALKKQDKFNFYRKIADELRQCNYLDCSVKYDGLRNDLITYNPYTNRISLSNSSQEQLIYDGVYTSKSLSNGFVKIELPQSIKGVGGASTDLIGVFSTNIVTSSNNFNLGDDLYKVVNKNLYNGNYSSITTGAKTVGTTSYNCVNLSEYISLYNNKKQVKELYYTSSIAVGKKLYYFEGNVRLYIGEITAVNTSKKTVTIKSDTLPVSNSGYIGKITSINNTEIKIEGNGFKFKISDTGKKIWYKDKLGQEKGIFEIKRFVDESNIEVEKLVEPLDNTSDYWYMSATYFSSLEHLEGKEVSVVGDGGYIGDYIVSNGTIDISNANVNKVGSAIIGLKYKGILKSPNSGLMLQGNQTFTNMKNLYKMVLWLSFSSGGKIGTNLYDLTEVQDFKPDGLYDIPPLPIDDYKEIEYEDTYEKDKHYFVVQDKPLPFHITAIIPYFKHVPKT